MSVTMIKSIENELIFLLHKIAEQPLNYQAWIKSRSRRRNFRSISILLLYLDPLHTYWKSSITRMPITYNKDCKNCKTLQIDRKFLSLEAAVMESYGLLDSY
jgi:hypothetical protein